MLVGKFSMIGYKGALAGIFLFLLAVFMVSFSFLVNVTNSAETSSSEQQVPSNISITKQVAISLSANLSAGVLFGSQDPGQNDINATGNFGGAGLNLTQYNVSIDSTTNTPIDICIKDNAPLTNGSNTIPNAGYRWDSDTVNNATLPNITDGGTFALDTTYDNTNKVASGVSSGVYHLRFQLDVPSGQAAGLYNNTIFFKGTDNTTAC